jgi:hypothetical protein
VRETARNVRWAALLVYAAAMPAYVYAFEHREDADYAREQGFTSSSSSVPRPCSTFSWAPPSASGGRSSPS